MQDASRAREEASKAPRIPDFSRRIRELFEPYRGRGYGKAAMVFAEEEARRRGLTRIALHVGARNDVARNLYRSLGFEENDIAMSKPV